ncbi:acyl-CoA thioesterase [Fimbriimonas ginsengisoli]|uniref:Thioesterase superfamily protein n=1 Tax=Fimbriimonas ginsengisoli Gsoil 348 TaxID=661478 RepID=A0A068NM61_FIMGI|nr:thioesterase family protein [Fimbriimonas ginsengisoli]AIE84507.1 thioesterase superfamily protein [Fimbriimonas ginsengisoli Gsoil 348]
MFEPAFTLTLIASPEDIDELGHVNNVVYLRWVEAVARAHSEQLGFGIDRYKAFAAVPVVRRHTLVYHVPAMSGDEIQVHTRIASLHGVRATRETRIERADTVLAEAETEWVWIDPVRNRPVRIPDDVAVAFTSG